MHLIDSHCHLTDEKFNTDRDFIIKDLDNFLIKAIINPSENIETSKKAVDLSKKYDNVYSCVGFHPENADEFKDSDIEILRELLKEEKCVGIGEIGLDYYWRDDNKKKQREVFIKQLELAKEVNKPVVIHSRDATGETFDILKEYKDQIICQMHCFSESKEMMQRYMKLGFYISLGGVVTFKNSKKAKEVAKEMPIDKLMLETDSPYMAPEPYRSLRNDPRKIIEVAKVIADLREMKLKKLIKHTTKNTERFFNI